MEENKQSVAGQLFDINEHLRYQNNNPAHRQSIYFDLPDEFSERLLELYHKAYTQAIVELKLADTGQVMVYVRQQIAQALGPVTFDQLLYLVHFIAGQLAYNSGYSDGHESGFAEGVTHAQEQAETQEVFISMGPTGQA